MLNIIKDDDTPYTMLSQDRRKCVGIAMFVIIQCAIVFVLSASVLHCMWTIDINVTSDYGKLVRIMYLYDAKACGYRLRKEKSTENVHLSNDTQGLQVKPIQWSAATVTVSTSFSERTRRYIELSIGVHVAWLLFAATMWFFIRSENILVLKYTIDTFFYYSIFMVMFDISMGMVYVANIQQCLTKGMILRYSGWSVEIKIDNPKEFAGWIPIIFCICWCRGIIILGVNIHLLRIMRRITAKIKKKEIKQRVMKEGFLPIPDPEPVQLQKDKTLYYRTGEKHPALMYSGTF